MKLSKLNTKKYPVGDIAKWIVAAPGVNIENVDQVLLGRLAALAEYVGKKITISSGWRSTIKQIDLYIKSGGKQDASGNWHGGSGMAARPGWSWHEYGLAIDTSTQWLRDLCSSEATDKQLTLMKFGLFKPLTIGNKTSVCEDWHIQPIETRGKKALYDGKSLGTGVETIKPKEKELPALKLGSKGESVKHLQELLKKRGYAITSDGSFGPKTQATVIAFQKAQKITADGSVGPVTWSKLGGN